MRFSDLPRPERLPAGILDPFTSSRPRPNSMAPSDSQPVYTMNVQASNPGTLDPFSQTVRPSSASLGTDPSGLARSSDLVKGI